MIAGRCGFSAPSFLVPFALGTSFGLAQLHTAIYDLIQHGGEISVQLRVIRSGDLHSVFLSVLHPPIVARKIKRDSEHDLLTLLTDCLLHDLQRSTEDVRAYRGP